jgi:dihydrofolate synthase/folylpolyglutamate synthase
VVLGPLAPEAETVVRRVAEARNAPLIHAERDVALAVSFDDGRPVLRLATPAFDYGSLTVGLRGEHQVHNAIVAIRLAEAARARGVGASFDAIAHAVRHARWPARLERLDLGGGRALLVDAAHNVDGAAALARYLRRWHPGRPPLVFAAMRDKDVDGLVRELLPAVGAVVVTAPATRRAEEPDVLAARIRGRDPERTVIVERHPRKAVERALGIAPLACVAGSIYLAGEVREAILRRAILP